MIRTRGLPYDATPEKIANFFHDCNIVGGKDGIHIKLTPEGNSSGEAYIELASEDDAKKLFTITMNTWAIDMLKCFAI